MSMDESNLINTREINTEDVYSLLQQAKKVSFDFFDATYIYSPLEASRELGLESKLVQQLVKEYVSQLLEANVSFRNYLLVLKKSQDNAQKLDFTPFEDLAHKNLGVARNLRIKDCEDILHKIMSENNLEYLTILVNVLESCAIKLSPTTALKTLQ